MRRLGYSLTKLNRVDEVDVLVEACDVMKNS